MGIVSGCNSKWIHLKEQRFKGQIGGQMGARQAAFEAINSSVNTAELRCCVPIRPVTFRALFPLWHSNGIFYGDFTFLLSIHMKGDTLFLSKGYRQGNTSALTLCCVSEAERTQKDGNELVRSCKDGCQEENESGTENEICILWDLCVGKGFFSYPPHLFSFFSLGGHESEAGQQPEEESQWDRNSAFGVAWSQAGSHIW